MARTTYEDVTQLVHWSGKITGIPRVMNELAIRAQKQDPNHVFVAWVKEVGAFCEVDLTKTLAHRGQGIEYVYENSGPVAPLTAEAPRPTALPLRASLTKKAKRLAKAGIARTRHVHPELPGRIERRLYKAAAARYKQPNLKKGDVIFITWGEWWDTNYLAMLEAHHAQGVHITTVIHDIGPMVAPQYSAHSTESLANYCARIVPVCSMVFCVSKNTQKDLTQWLKQHEYTVPPMSVMRLGEDFTDVQPTEPLHQTWQESGLKGDDYLMCVGTVELKKNHLLLYYVYKLAQERHIALPKLVVAGRKGWMSDLFMELVTKDPDISTQIIFVEEPSDSELIWLYQHCCFTVLPSYYEGWGIPVAESLYYGVPCLSAGTSSMVEIAEGIVQHFSPSSSDECLAAIQRWLDPKEYAKAKKVTSTYKPTSWDTTYQQVATKLETL